MWKNDLQRSHRTVSGLHEKRGGEEIQEIVDWRREDVRRAPIGTRVTVSKGVS